MDERDSSLNESPVSISSTAVIRSRLNNRFPFLVLRQRFLLAADAQTVRGTSCGIGGVTVNGDPAAL